MIRIIKLINKNNRKNNKNLSKNKEMKIYSILIDLFNIKIKI